MSQLAAIAAGGALGALLRYWVSTGVHGLAGRGFPWGTLVVNVLGSLLMGFLAVWLVERSFASPATRGFLLVGLLGAFTTFSTFSMETLSLAESGELMRALANVGASVILCLLAVAAGVMVARQL